jgi:hypothetical protein
VRFVLRKDGFVEQSVELSTAYLQNMSSVKLERAVTKVGAPLRGGLHAP